MSPSNGAHQSLVGDRGLAGKAQQAAPTGGSLVLYGPYRRERPTHLSQAMSNSTASLRAAKPRLGHPLRSEDVASLANNRTGPHLRHREPANNLCVVFTRQ